ncbi:MAG TPA: MFS transporter [Gaiellales bacterium]|nr:MFS transporter [Gaiellales bacterium]
MRPPWRVPPLLRQRVFRNYWSAQSISMLGDQVSALALPLVGVLTLHASPAAMGVLTALVWAPNLVFAVHAGALTDRLGRRRRVMIASDLARAVLLVSVPVAAWMDVLTMAQLYAVAFAVGTLSVFFNVSDATLFMCVVERDEFMAANSLVYGSRAATFMAGPSLGGILTQAVTAPAALLVDAVSFVGSAGFLGRVDPVEPPPQPPEPGHVTAGIRYVRGSPIVFYELASCAMVNFFNFAFFAVFLLYATRELHVRAGTLGVVLGAAAVGSLIGAFLTGRIAGRIGVGPAFCVGIVLFPAPLILVPLAGGPHALVLACLFLAEFGSGVGVMILDITAGSITASVVPGRLRARVAGAFSIVNYGVRPLGALAAGAAASVIGIHDTLWIATVGGALSALWLVPSPLPHLRTLPAEPIEVQPPATAQVPAAGGP